MLSLRRPEGNSDKNRRLLQSLSRFQETPATLLVELKDGNYVALGEPGETAVKDARDLILAYVPSTEAEAVDLNKLLGKVKFVLKVKVSRQTAQRALDGLRREGSLIRIGKGKKGDAFRYFRPENPFCPTSNA